VSFRTVGAPVSFESLRAIGEQGVHRAIRGEGAVTRVTAPIYWTVAPRYHRLQYSTDFDDDPFELHRIDPARIRRFTRRSYPPWRGRKRLFGTVMGGEWDTRPHTDAPSDGGPPEDLFYAERIEDGLLYRAIDARFRRGVPWRETQFVERAIEYLEAGRERVWHDCSTPADVLGRCDRLTEIYRSMEHNGCLSYRERTPIRERDVGFLGSLGKEIAVDIGRDGELLLVSGKHRFCLSRALGLTEIPVCVLVRHRNWMGTRRDVRDAETPEAIVPDLLDHPDLADLLDES